ncbi:MAG: ATP-binding protein [Acidilobaceae archaeon]|nr:ATP-binding protein [Acidilobaceae archaeon]MCX8164983.1 ATP-binding protein [Acidilobaceae archaeon]MDW7974500.1 ATP-binding protein [Sulfolobales archaeon]
MSSPAVYLEGSARKYALAAAKAEGEGNYESAITNLRKAVELLEDLVKNYPDHPMAMIYRRLIGQYKRKLEDLERKRMEPASGGDDEVYVVENKEEAPPFVMREKPSITFNDIAGLEEAKEAIREVIIYPVKRPDLFPLGWHRGVLLYGPPGTGKTMLGIAAANEAKAEFLYVDAASIMSKWLGEGEKNVKRLFSYARERASQVPVVVFIDEVDALLGYHSTEIGGEVRVRNQFLKEMDGVLDKMLKVHLYVIAATNKPWKLDEAFLRRFQKRVYVPLPSKEARKELLRKLTEKLRLQNVDLDELAEMLEGYSGSDIRDVVQDAYMITVREVFERGGSGEPRPVSMDDFKRVLEKRKPSVDAALTIRFEEWASRFGAT